ncbi:hypothetical protein [Atopobium sp. oral taxon 810]|uniref:hypothetical protein n=1 Tax=Atopobium sp. oral taxon 810 TaxID=712158 RepID=UPI001E3D02C2|nr:hypothetical protein [Atopobium sp. oral taxon 810]
MAFDVLINEVGVSRMREYLSDMMFDYDGDDAQGFQAGRCARLRALCVSQGVTSRGYRLRMARCGLRGVCCLSERMRAIDGLLGDGCNWYRGQVWLGRWRTPAAAIPASGS